MSRIEIIAMIKPPARHSTTNATSIFCCNDIPAFACRQQVLYLRPLPHGQGAFRPMFSIRTIYFETAYLARTSLRPVVLILKLGWCPQVMGRVLGIVSSHRAYLGHYRPGWLTRDWVLRTSGPVWPAPGERTPSSWRTMPRYSRN